MSHFYNVSVLKLNVVKLSVIVANVLASLLRLKLRRRKQSLAQSLRTNVAQLGERKKEKEKKTTFLSSGANVIKLFTAVI
jgi:hypothetical protein